MSIASQFVQYLIKVQKRIDRLVFTINFVNLYNLRNLSWLGDESLLNDLFGQDLFIFDIYFGKITKKLSSKKLEHIREIFKRKEIWSTIEIFPYNRCCDQIVNIILQKQQFEIDFAGKFKILNPYIPNRKNIYSLLLKLDGKCNYDEYVSIMAYFIVRNRKYEGKFVDDLELLDCFNGGYISTTNIYVYIIVLRYKQNYDEKFIQDLLFVESKTKDDDDYFMNTSIDFHRLILHHTRLRPDLIRYNFQMDPDSLNKKISTMIKTLKEYKIITSVISIINVYC